jgi:hypothetical protein
MKHKYAKRKPRNPKKSKKIYISCAIYRPLINYNSQKENLEYETVWLKKTLTKTLNKHAKPIKITAYFKR